MSSQDFTANGTKIEGTYENDRNRDHRDLYKSIIREVYGAQDVIIAHHLAYATSEQVPDPDHPGKTYTYEFIQEIPSADTMIFDHGVAKKLFGSNYKAALVKLALEPAETRDNLLAELMKVRASTLEVTSAGPLAENLRSAEAAHAEFEKTLGHRDDNWSEWYANYLIDEGKIVNVG